jgi:hypothetical protein
VRVEWVSDVGAIDALEAPWRELEAAVQHRTHLSTFDFLVS